MSALRRSHASATRASKAARISTLQPPVLTQSTQILRSFAASSTPSASKPHEQSSSKHSKRNDSKKKDIEAANSSPPTAEPKKREKVNAALLTDEEIQRRFDERSGEGGLAGTEFEDGKPATVKANVRNNFFRYI